MRIVHLLAPAQAGGLERVVQALAIGQRRRGHHVTAVPIVDHWTEDHSFAGPLAREGIDVRPITVGARDYRRERRLVAALLSDLRPDVVHSHGYHTDVIDGGVVRRAGVPVVSTAHGFTRGPWRNRAYEALDRYALRQFDAVAVVSKPLADELRRSGVSDDRIHLVPNAWSQIAMPVDRIAARAHLGLPADGLVVGWVGRMTHEKGLDILVAAVPALRDLPLTVCAIGDGPERSVEEANATTNGVTDRIRWAGLVREAGRYFQAFDAFCLSSRTEGVPMVILEAIAARVPLVVTAVGGVPDVVSAREARLVRSEDVAGLADALRSVLTERVDAAARAEHALERLHREFAEDTWLSRYDAVYASAAGRARSTRSG